MMDKLCLFNNRQIFSGRRIQKSLTVIFFLSLFISAFLLTGCQDKTANTWIGTWGTAQQLVEPRNMPPEPGLTNNTLRQVVRVSIGGEKFRIRFSNEHSTSPVTMKTVHVALSAGGDAIDLGTDKMLKFEGKTEITIEPGMTVMSDPIAFDLQPRTDVAITIYFGDTAPDVTGHPGSRTTSYIVAGDATDAEAMPDAVTTDHWYIIDSIDVLAPETAKAVVVIGNSITDGRGSGTNKQNRWPDELSRRLLDNPGTEHVAVLNMGIGGNCVLRNCLGPAAITRFENDVLAQPGVRWLIILEGINDIGGTRTAEDAEKVAQDLIAAYERMIERAHENDILVYGATLLPFAGSFYDSPAKQTAHQTVNNWIKSSGQFDAVIDLEKALTDPENPFHMRPEADTGDHLHPNETGHRMMGEAVDLALFQ